MLITLSTLLFGTTMTVGEGLLSLGISMTANAIGDKVKGMLKPKECDALYFAYEKAISRWQKDNHKSGFLQYHVHDLKALFVDYLKGSLDNVNPELEQLMLYWYEEICNSDECKEYLRKTQFSILVDNDEEIKRLLAENGAQLNALELKLDEAKSEVCKQIFESHQQVLNELGVIQTAIAPKIVGLKEYSPILEYISRYCHYAKDGDPLWIGLNQDRERATTLECIMGAANKQHEKRFVLYSSAQAGKTTELSQLAYEIQQTGYFAPVLYEAKYFVRVQDYTLPSCESYNHKPIVLLVDGIDEAANYDNTRVMLEGYAKQHPSMIIIASCRTNYRDLSTMEGFTELILEDMYWSDVCQYINDKAVKSDGLLRQIEENKLQSLFVTPFIIRNIVEIWNTRQMLPSDKVELYDNLFHLTYDKQREKVPPLISVSFESLRDYYIRVAMVMQLTNKPLLSRDELMKICNGDNQLLEDSLRVNLLEKQGDKYEFVHNAFREYFASVYLTNQSLEQVQKIVCFHGSTEVKSQWYDVMLLWIMQQARANQGRLPQEVIEWLQNDGQQILIHSDYHFVDEATRTSLFKSIIEYSKDNNQPLGNLWSEDYRALMEFGDTNESIEYLTSELASITEACMHLTNLMGLIPYISWSMLKYNKVLHDALVIELQKKHVFLSSDDETCCVSSFLYTPYFSKQASVYYPLLSGYNSIAAVSAMVYMILQSGSVEQYIDYLLQHDQYLTMTDGHVADRTYLYKSYQQVQSEASIIKVLTLMSDEEYIRKFGHDEEYAETEEVLLDKVKEQVQNGNTTLPESLKPVFALRIKTIYPYIASEAQCDIVLKYREIFEMAGVLTEEMRNDVESRLINRQVSEEERQRWREEHQKAFDEMCDYDTFKAQVHEACDRLEKTKEISSACVGFNEFVHFFMIDYSRYGNANPDVLRMTIDNETVYQSFRMCTILRIMSEKYRQTIVSPDQKALCTATAHQFVDRMLKGDFNFMSTYMECVFSLLIRKDLVLADDELKHFFRFSDRSISEHDAELFEAPKKHTLFETIEQQLGEEQFLQFVVQQMKDNGGNLPELVFLQSNAYVLEHDCEEAYDNILARLLNDQNPAFVSELLKLILNKSKKMTEMVHRLFDKIPSLSNKIDFLQAVVDCDTYHAWALDKLQTILPTLTDRFYRHQVLSILCRYGVDSALGTLLHHPEDLPYVGLTDFKFSSSEALDKLLQLYPKATKIHDSFLSSERVVLNNIIQIAGTDEALLNSAKAVLSAFKGALPDHEHQIDQTIRACSYAFKNNNERVLTINEALGLLG